MVGGLGPLSIIPATVAGGTGAADTGDAVDIMGGCVVGALVDVCGVGVLAVGVAGPEIPGVAGVLVGVSCGVPGCE